MLTTHDILVGPHTGVWVGRSKIPRKGRRGDGPHPPPIRPGTEGAVRGTPRPFSGSRKPLVSHSSLSEGLSLSGRSREKVRQVINTVPLTGLNSPSYWSYPTLPRTPWVSRVSRVSRVRPGPRVFDCTVVQRRPRPSTVERN